jgi:hypothetical protein
VKLFRRSEPSEYQQILDHYRAFWGRRQVQDVHWTPGPIEASLPDLHIAKVAPTAQYSFWTYATIGAWRATADTDHGLEFIVVSREDDPTMLLRLGMIAYYQVGPTANRLGVGHLLPIGEGWVDGSPLDSILFSLPYLWGPKLEHCQLVGRHVQVLWAIPIHDDERTLARVRGADALEELFEERSFNYLDPFRPSVVGSGPHVSFVDAD